MWTLVSDVNYRGGHARRTPATDLPGLASHLRLSVFRASRTLRRERQAGISPTLLAALSTIERHGPMTAGALAAHEQVRKPTVTRILGALVDESRRTHPRPGGPPHRMGAAHATGRSLMRTVRRRTDRYLAQRLRKLDAEDLATLEQAAEILDRITEAVVSRKVTAAIGRVLVGAHVAQLPPVPVRPDGLGDRHVDELHRERLARVAAHRQRHGARCERRLYFLPVLLLGAYGGVLADRFDKRHILMLTRAAYGVVALALWALVASDVAELWMVYALSLASGVVTAIDNPSRQSFYIEMVGEEHVRNAVSLNSGVSPARASSAPRSPGC